MRGDATTHAGNRRRLRPLCRLRSIHLTAVVGPPGAIVHVRWQPSVDDAAREVLEARFRLTDGRTHEERTWQYELIDSSRDNIRALVLHEAVADTHHIDRSSYVIDSAAERTPRRLRFGTAGTTGVRVVDTLAAILGAFAVVLITMASSRRMATWLSLSTPFPLVRRVAQGAAGAFARWVYTSIPELDAAALGAFRIVLGGGLVWVALTTEVNPIRLQLQRHYGALDGTVVHWIAASPSACNAVEFVMFLSAVLFAVGLWTSWAYVGFVAAYFLATLIALETSGAHDMGLPFVTFLGWLTVTWADGLSIDRWRQGPLPGENSEGAPSRTYGFAVWWPGLTLGVALLAAAFAKLTVTGLEWIAGGAVKYHFVLDAEHAPVNWGLWVASHHWVAVLLSLGAIILEAGFIVNIFTRGPAARFVAGMAGAGLFLGLYLFQGIYWPGWLVLVVAFLPWMLLNRHSPRSLLTSAAAAPAGRTAQVTAVAVLLCTQGYASATQTQAEPLLSNFPMYSNSYASPEAFEHSRRWQMTRIVSVQADGRDIAQATGNLRDEDLDLLMELAVERSAWVNYVVGGEWPARTVVCERYRRVLGTLPTEVTFTLERTGFDWTAGRFREYAPLPAAPVPLAELCPAVPAARLAR